MLADVSSGTMGVNPIVDGKGVVVVVVAAVTNGVVDFGTGALRRLSLTRDADTPSILAALSKAE